MNSPRNIFVIGFSIFMALSVPQYFKEYTTTAGHGPSHSRAHWVLQIFSHHNNVIMSIPPQVSNIYTPISISKC
jgi:nucleobase transporter 1/2